MLFHSWDKSNNIRQFVLYDFKNRFDAFKSYEWMWYPDEEITARNLR